jgi:hypothetical protein
MLPIQVAKLQRNPLRGVVPPPKHTADGCVKKIATMAAVLAALLFLTSAKLPERGPLPQPKPQADENAPPQPDAAPTPQPRPDEKEKPAIVPPQSETSPPGETSPGENPQEPAEKTLEEQHLTIEPESESDHSECVKELQSLGVTFKEIPRIDDGNGCGMDKPIVVSQALPGIKLKPEATFRCPVALALARWMKESVIPAASVAANDQGGITTINQASAYICRLRNGAAAGKISEHARGNAIDIASFGFAKGEDIAVQPRREDSTLTGAFQRAVSASACLYFNTVLDPESDAAHEHHFHLDVLQRKGGYRYCH